MSNGSKHTGIKHALVAFLRILGILFLVCLITLGVMNLIVYYSTNDSVFDPAEIGESEYFSDSHYDAVIVLGCGIEPDGTPQPVLADRLRTAAMVYNTGCADYILVSGDSRYPLDHDETGSMKTFLIAEGISPDKIVCDPMGLSTYETMRRAVSEYDIKTAVVVTSGFHTHRSVYNSHEFGIVSVGVKAINSGYIMYKRNYVREFFARGKDFVFCIFKPEGDMFN